MVQLMNTTCMCVYAIQSTTLKDMHFGIGYDKLNYSEVSNALVMHVFYCRSKHSKRSHSQFMTIKICNSMSVLFCTCMQHKPEVYSPTVSALIYHVKGPGFDSR